MTAKRSGLRGTFLPHCLPGDKNRSEAKIAGRRLPEGQAQLGNVAPPCSLRAAGLGPTGPLASRLSPLASRQRHLVTLNLIEL